MVVMKTLSLKTKIVVIGAGSASFGLVNLGAIIRHPDLKGIHLSLVDLNAHGLESITKLALRMNKEWDAQMTITSTTDRTQALIDANYIILSVAIDREPCWKSDVDIALKYGIRHYGENGGPGALMHTARNVALIMPILRDIERLCPEAYVMNFTNPVPRICIAAAKYTKVKMVGICHAIDFGYLMSAKLFQNEYGFKVPKDYAFTWQGSWDAYGDMAHQAQEKFSLLAAGINHFTFFLSLKDKVTGIEHLPDFKHKFLNSYPEFEPYTRDIIETMDLVPVSGDCHMLEYFPFTHNVAKKAWEHYDIQMYPLLQAEDDRHAMWDEIDELASGKGSIDHLLHTHTERAEQIIVAMIKNEPLYDQAVNLPNKGYISNLPEGAIVEVPAWIDSQGIHGQAVGDLPELAALWCRRQIETAELAVKAAISGDKKMMLQALLIDQMIDDIPMAKAMLEEYLIANKQYLPAFDKKGE
jgi:alpha-galactosidase